MLILQAWGPTSLSNTIDWLSKDWDGEKAKAREQKSLIDFDPPRLDSDKQTTDLERWKKGSISRWLTYSKFINTPRQTRRGITRGLICTGSTTRSVGSNSSDKCGKTGGHHGRKQQRTDRTRTEITKRGRRICHIHWDAKWQGGGQHQDRYRQICVSPL